jgi:hypothetical protein
MLFFELAVNLVLLLLAKTSGVIKSSTFQITDRQEIGRTMHQRAAFAGPHTTMMSAIGARSYLEQSPWPSGRSAAPVVRRALVELRNACCRFQNPVCTAVAKQEVLNKAHNKNRSDYSFIVWGHTRNIIPTGWLLALSQVLGGLGTRF